MNHAEVLAGRVLSQHLTTRQTRVLHYLRARTLNGVALAAGDAVALAASLVTGAAISYWFRQNPFIYPWIWTVVPLWWAGAAMFRLLPSWGLGPVEEVRRLTLLIVTVFSAMAVALFLAKRGAAVSRFTLSAAFLVSLVAIPLIRLRVKRILIMHREWGVRTVIYGAGEAGAQIVALLQEEQGLGYSPAGVLDDDAAHQGMSYGGVRVLGSMDLVIPDAPVAIVATSCLDREREKELLEGPLSSYRTVILVPDLCDAPSLWVRPHDLNGTLGLEITDNLSRPLTRFVKRSGDVVATLACAPLWVPLVLLLAVVIWAGDRHFPFFLQERLGRGRRAFKVLKLRTMVPDADALIRAKLDESDDLRLEWTASFKLQHDPRITRIGSFLRRFSLDELPQLMNVLMGDMSLVGPRPLPRYHHDQLPTKVRAMRERVRPGLTGFWQVSGRSRIGTAGMERWDAYYVRNWSLWLDVVVLIRTWRAVFEGTGAY